MARKKQPVYKATNKSRAIEVFEARKKYRQDIDITELYGGSKYFLDLWHDLSLYGRIDHDGDCVLPKKSSLSPLAQSPKGERAYVINFVSDMYASLTKDLKKAQQIGKFPKDSIFFDMRVKSAALDLPSHYRKKIMNAHDFFVENYINYHRHIYVKTIGFEDYLENFLIYMYSNNSDRKSASNCQITRTAVFSDALVSPTTSGLCIEHAWETGYDVDDSKVQHYYEDVGFSYYREACLRSGFKIDINAPWRIVADLGSPVTQEHMQKHGLTLDNMFQTLYNKTYEDDYSLLQSFLISSYNLWAGTYSLFSQIRVDRNNGRKQVVIRRHKTTKQEQTAEGKNEMWIEAFVKVRNAECSFPFDQLRVNTIISKAIDIDKSISNQKAIDYINNEFRGHMMTAHDFSFNDEPEPIAPGVGNMVVAPMSTQGGSSGGSSGY